MATAAQSATGSGTIVTTVAAATTADTLSAAAVGRKFQCRAGRCGFDGLVVVERPWDRSS